MAATPFVGELQIFPYTFAPVGWLPCDGQLVNISDFDVLFALIGTTYGGDGQTTFALPDLRGRGNVGYGPGAGLTNYFLGQTGGTESVSVTSAQLPIHNHPATALSTAGDNADPTGRYPALAPTGLGNTYGPAGSASALATASTTSSGGGQSHENRQPSLTLLFCIAYEGIFPSQN